MDTLHLLYSDVLVEHAKSPELAKRLLLKRVCGSEDAKPLTNGGNNEIYLASNPNHVLRLPIIDARHRNFPDEAKQLDQCRRHLRISKALNDPHHPDFPNIVPELVSIERVDYDVVGKGYSRRLVAEVYENIRPLKNWRRCKLVTSSLDLRLEGEDMISREQRENRGLVYYMLLLLCFLRRRNRRLMHGDINPNNIVFTDSGIRLIDFDKYSCLDSDDSNDEGLPEDVRCTPQTQYGRNSSSDLMGPESFSSQAFIELMHRNMWDINRLQYPCLVLSVLAPRHHFVPASGDPKKNANPFAKMPLEGADVPRSKVRDLTLKYLAFFTNYYAGKWNRCDSMTMHNVTDTVDCADSAIVFTFGMCALRLGFQWHDKPLKSQLLKFLSTLGKPLGRLLVSCVHPLPAHRPKVEHILRKLQSLKKEGAKPLFSSGGGSGLGSSPDPDSAAVTQPLSLPNHLVAAAAAGAAASNKDAWTIDYICPLFATMLQSRCEEQHE